jgi:hypothetical protein
MSKDDRDRKKLVDELLAQLDGETGKELKARLSDDPALAEIANLLGRSGDRQDSAEWQKLEASAHLLLKSLLRDAQSAQSDPDGQHGVLVFDSGLLPLPEGVRPATVDTRRLRYQVGKNRLELSLYPVSVKTYELIGQLSDQSNEHGFTVELLGARTRFSATSDRFGVFRFPRITGGKYQLRIADDGKTIAVVDLEI